MGSAGVGGRHVTSPELAVTPRKCLSFCSSVRRYDDNTDKEMHQLRLVREDGRPLGVINWFAVHPTSMNNTNTLISSDNVGAAAIFFERRMNGPESIVGRVRV